LIEEKAKVRTGGKGGRVTYIAELFFEQKCWGGSCRVVDT
jgi:hypothetical protein